MSISPKTTPLRRPASNYEIVDGDSLRSLENWDDSDYVVGCVTVFCGSIPVRLIDNVKYKTR